MSVFAGDRMEEIKQALIIEGAADVVFVTVPGAAYVEARVVVRLGRFGHIMTIISDSAWLKIVDYQCDSSVMYTILTHCRVAT